MDTVLLFLQKIFWGPATLLLILLFGIYLSIRLRFFQIFKLKLWLFETLRDLFSKKRSSSETSPLAALCTALAGSAGTGNIIGVAVAVCAAGPGVVFWLWFSSFFSMMTVFGENILGALYRTKKNGKLQGGAMYYIEHGLGSRKLALFFAGACVLSSVGMGNMVQAGAIAGMLKELGVSSLWCGIVLAVLVFCVISGGFQRVSAVAQRLIPVITLLYLLLCFWILFFCRNNLLPSLKLILSEAFSLKGTVGGMTSSFFLSMREGVSKGIFTNEAGLGSSVMAHTCAQEQDPVRLGMWGIFQVFLDTTVMCTLTGLCLVVTGAYTMDNSIAMCSRAFSLVFGTFGTWFVILATLLFAFATITSWYVYGEFSLLYLHKNASLLLFRLAFVFCLFFACMSTFSRLWVLSDIINGLMALPNLTALYLLSEKIIAQTRSYTGKS